MGAASFANYVDSERLSRAINHANVSAMRLDSTPFDAELATFEVCGWRIQDVQFRKGHSTCAGDGPSRGTVFLLPLTGASGHRILGQQVETSTVCIYGPGSEHVDITCSGAREVVIAPPDEFLHAMDWQDTEPRWLRRGGGIGRAESGAVSRFAGCLDRLRSLASDHPDFLCSDVATRAIADSMSISFAAVIDSLHPVARKGRPERDRHSLCRRVADYLEDRKGANLTASEMVGDLDISLATLHRAFLSLYGVAPAHYFRIRKLHEARRRLESPGDVKVTKVAEECGFWDLSRFASAYKKLFGETPSESMRNGRR